MAMVSLTFFSKLQFKGLTTEEEKRSVLILRFVFLVSFMTDQQEECLCFYYFEVQYSFQLETHFHGHCIYLEIVAFIKIHFSMSFCEKWSHF